MAPSGDQSMLSKAASDGNLELLTGEIRKQVARSGLGGEVYDMPLIAAVKNNHLECVRELLLVGADPDQAALLGCTHDPKIKEQLWLASTGKACAMGLDPSSSPYEQHRHVAPRPKVACRYFAQGRCRYGTFCRFSHSTDAGSTFVASRSIAVKPKDVLDYADDKFLNFSAGTTEIAMRQYAATTHPGLTKLQTKSYNPGTPLAIMYGLPQPSLEESDDTMNSDAELDERIDNFGFRQSELEDLICQGVKPWDEDAFSVLAALNDYDDYDDYYY